jgi:BRCT domain type II-containing protein
MKTKEVDPLEKKRRVENYKTFMNRGGADAPGSKTIPDGAPNCLKNLTFVISGEYIHTDFGNNIFTDNIHLRCT